MRAMKLPDGFGIELFAAEPMVSSPVGIAVDEKGAVYAAETFRHGTSVRGHFDWLEEDLAARTVADHGTASVRGWTRRMSRRCTFCRMGESCWRQHPPVR